MAPAAERRRVVVVGGGITGLACAWFLREACDVTVLEAGHRLGGRIGSLNLRGVQVDSGPDSFLARVPWAADLCRQLGLGDELVAPATGTAYVWTGGRLRALPSGLVLGVPYRLGPLLRSGIVSTGGVARAALDLLLPRRPAAGPSGDASIAAIVGGRLGAEVLDRLVEPLLGGINAGRADELSINATAPAVAAAARSHRSLLRGLRTQAPPDRSGPDRSGPGRPVFLTLRGGLGRLVARLAEELEKAGVDVRTGDPVSAIERRAGGAYTVVGAEPVIADAVVLTTPAPATAGLLAGLHAGASAAAELAAIRHASVAVVTLLYPRAVVPPIDGSGFLVPRVDGRLLTACTWLSLKWPHLARPGTVLLRASVGRAGDTRALSLDDAALLGRVHAELVEAMGIAGPPSDACVTRWPDAFAQYDVGHLDRVERIEATLARELPGLFVAGAAYRGVGIAACIRQAQETAARARAHVGSTG